MKSKRLILIVMMIAVIVILPASKGHSLLKPTHAAINESISNRNINDFSLSKYLINQLGFKEGTKEPLRIGSDERAISNWISYGGIQEDNPEGTSRQIVGRARNQNHFHNPLNNWDEAGLHVFPYAWQSSVVWTQNRVQSPGGRWSWYDARDYFYKGLTLTDKKQRDSAMANCFRALGQLMHLVQDASVPAHVRDDVHILYMYENWVEDMRTSVSEEDRRIFANFIANPISFNPSILNGNPNPLAPIPIAKIIDTGKYHDGRNPSDTAGTAIGIAEYTNANFFSEDTVFSNAFPYPGPTSARIEPYIIPDPRDSSKTVIRKYFYKYDDGATGYRLATVGMLKEYIMNHFPFYKGRERNSLDGGVYEDYAWKLLPRAVGYSAGLLEYFFRGTLEISVPDDQVFSIMEGIANPQWIMSIRATVRNTTAKEKDSEGKTLSYEEMQKGELKAILRYKKGTAEEYIYSVSKAVPVQSLSYQDPTESNFDFSDDPIPSGIRDVSLFMIFKGTLGNENDIAVAVGMRALSPETIEITLPAKGVYAQTEDPAQGFSEIKLLSRNTGVPEMSDGSIKLIIQYRLALEDPFQSKPVPISENIYYTMVPEKNSTRSIPKDNAVELSFNLTQTPIPLYATDVYLQVIYRGKLGPEAEALAVGLKDISEPTPMDIFNNMDFICLNSNWYVAGSPEAIAQVDEDGDGIAEPGEWDVYAHDLKDIYIRFSSSNAPQYASTSEYNFYIPYLSAGEFIRKGFILHDYQLNFSGKVIQVVPKDPNDHFVTYLNPAIFTSSGIKNQTRYGKQNECCEALGISHCMDYSEIYCCEKMISEWGCKIVNHPTFHPFRDQDMWGGIIYDHQPYPLDSSCPY